MTEEPYDAGSYRSVSRRAKSARYDEKARIETLRLIMSQPNGRAFILDILERCNIFASGFATNALILAFNSGERNVGLQLFADVVASCPDDYVNMMKERTQRDLAREANRGRSSTDERDDTADGSVSADHPAATDE